MLREQREGTKRNWGKEDTPGQRSVDWKSWHLQPGLPSSKDRVNFQVVSPKLSPRTAKAGNRRSQQAEWQPRSKPGHGHAVRLLPLLSQHRGQTLQEHRFLVVYYYVVVLVLAWPGRRMSRNLAVVEANSKRAIRVILYSKRSRAPSTLINALRLQNKRRTSKMIPFGKNKR